MSEARLSAGAARSEDAHHGVDVLESLTARFASSAKRAVELSSSAGKCLPLDACRSLSSQHGDGSQRAGATHAAELSARFHRSVECGVASGILVTAVLNPWDRALFLSVINRTPFLSLANWRNPYQGVGQAVVQRSMSSGLYFPVEDTLTPILGSRMLGGFVAGTLNGALLSPLAYIKYQSWGAADYPSFVSTAGRLYREGGPSVFFRGMTITALRDSVFGLFFSIRNTIQVDGDHARTKHFAISLCAAALGTTLSSPLNYVRNYCYAEKIAVPVKSDYWARSLRDLAAETRRQATGPARLKYLQMRLRIGWGTLRAATGMALMDLAYRTCNAALAAGG